MTTVGYGDMVPITIAGRMLGVFCMFSGIILMAICVIIIGGKFEQVRKSSLQERKKTSTIAGVAAHAANPNFPDSAPNTYRRRVLVKLSTGSPRIK